MASRVVSTIPTDINRKKPVAQLSDVFDRKRAGIPDEINFLDELEAASLVRVSVRTLRDSRTSGKLLGRHAPLYTKEGRSVRYRLFDVLEWLRGARVYANTAEAFLDNREEN